MTIDGRWTGMVFAALAAIMAMPCGTVEANEKVPAFWKKTMVNDPTINIPLQTFSKPLPDPAAEAIKNIMLSNLLSTECSGASLNKKAQKQIRKAAGLASLKGKAWDDAAFQANGMFTYFNFQSMAHLCAGIDYLYGPQGVLAKDLMKAGTGQPKNAYDPGNPFIRPKPIKH